MDKNKKNILVLFVVLIVVGFAWSFYAKNIASSSIASGTIEATEVVVSSKIQGRVLKINVDQGSYVLSGDVLAEIEAGELAENLKSARAKYDLATYDFERNKKLLKGDAISQQTYDNSKTNLDLMEAALETAKIQMDYSMIKAPISGVVLVKAIETGELASFGTPIVTLADLSNVNLIVYLSEKDIGKIKLGNKVFVYVDAYPDEKFSGRITYISDTAEFTPKSIQTKDERTKQVFGVKIKISNPDQKLKPGMPADAEFTPTS